MAFRITDNPSDPTCPILGNVQRAGREIESDMFSSCIRYVNEFRGKLTCEVEMQASTLRDFMIAGVDAPVVSERLAKILNERSSNDIQLFPVSLNGVQARYYLLNVITQVDCLDESRSEFSKWTEEQGQPKKIGNYRGVSKLWLDLLRMRNHNCFRVDRWNVAMVWSRAVLSDCESLGITGVLAHPVSD